jgi:hypothetical protein
MQHGKLIQLSQEELPCSNSKTTAHGLEGLNDLPGGADLKKPYFVLQVKKFVFEYDPDGKSVQVLVEAELTNRGESSVTKDWSLCLLEQGNKAVHFNAESLLITKHPQIGDKAISLADATIATPLEHGHVLDGWLSFHVPKDDSMLRRFTGSVQCRDYLDRLAASLFKPEKAN